MTLVRITRPGCASILLRIPETVDWMEVVERCAKEFSEPKPIGGPEKISRGAKA